MMRTLGKLLFLLTVVSWPGSGMAATIEDTAAARQLAQEMVQKFTPEHAESAMEKGPLHFKTWEAFYTFIAVLHHIEPTMENLLKLPSWSSFDWHQAKQERWDFIMKVNFDKDSSGLGTIRGPQEQGSYFIGSAKKSGVSVVGAFGGSKYNIISTKNDMRVIQPFWYTSPNCCVKPVLEWDGTMYKSAKPGK